MILNKAVLTTNTLGASEIIADGENGILCCSDEQQIAVDVEMLMRKPQKLEQLEKSVQKIDFKKQNQKYICQFEKLL